MNYYIGIDLGGTKISGGVVNEKGEIVKRYSIKTSKDKSEVLDGINHVISELLNDFDEVSGIGIGSPGNINTELGKVTNIGGNIVDWANTDIKSYVENVFPNYDIYIENDANCAALCEKWIGAAKDLDSFVLITLGTGLGGGIYIDKSKLVHGHNYLGGELGHVIFSPDGRQCMCGQKGCVERYISGTAIELNYEELTGNRITGEEIIERMSTDENAKKAVKQFAYDFGIFLTSIKNMLDPAGVIIGGGVINSAEYWWEEMLDSYEKHINNYSDINVIKAAYLNDAGIIGAASLPLFKGWK
ncbi:MAG: ROK family protein [Tissierellia bacterium]|nr:ROK family protein [Tissierellia bacterium]